MVGADSANLRKMGDRVKNISEGGSASASSCWLGAALPRGFADITDQVDSRGWDLLNADSEFGGAKTLFESSKPSRLGVDKGKRKAGDNTDGTDRDWVESDTDPQLMLFMPFHSTLKIHTLHITSLPPPPPSSAEVEDEIPMRPRTIQLYTNRAHNLGFEEAEDIQATQTFELSTKDWDSETGTAKLELRYVKFQNVTSLVLFVVDGDGEGERTRVDRIRIIGESGEKREMGKLEKIGDELGE